MAGGQGVHGAPREEIKFKLERYRQDLGDRLIGQMDGLAMAEYLDQLSNNAYTKHSGLCRLRRGQRPRRAKQRRVDPGEKGGGEEATAAHARRPEVDNQRRDHDAVAEARDSPGIG